MSAGAKSPAKPGSKVKAAQAKTTQVKTPVAPGSNWEMLQKTLPKAEPKQVSSKGKERAAIQVEQSGRQARKQARREFMSTGIAALAKQNDFGRSGEAGPSTVAASIEAEPTAGSSNVTVSEGVVFLPPPSDKPLVNELRQMVAGLNHLSEGKKAPGNYIAIDCEMVGLGVDGSESALARVSLVNYHGHTLLDTFVQPQERVTDYRTWVSGIREEDILSAPTFEVVQKQVAELVEGRVLIGHAISNDTKALLLSHPSPLVRDTQTFKALREVAKTKRPGLKKLVELSLGVKIQAGAHSSVTDARATMALYRLHKPEWESILRKTTEAFLAKTKAGGGGGGKRKRGDQDDDGVESEEEGRKAFPGGGRRGISSGLGVIVKRGGKRVAGAGRNGNVGSGMAVGGGGGGGGGKWWEESAT